jgi:hypothetical protein
MIPNNDGNATSGAGKKPVDHLRAFVSSVMEPARKPEEVRPVQEGDQPPTSPYRGRDITLDKSEDRTLKFLLAGAASVVVLVLLILGLSQKHTIKKPKADAPGLGRVQQPQTEVASSNSSIVPKTSLLLRLRRMRKGGSLRRKIWRTPEARNPRHRFPQPDQPPRIRPGH